MSKPSCADASTTLVTLHAFLVKRTAEALFVTKEAARSRRTRVVALPWQLVREAVQARAVANFSYYPAINLKLTLETILDKELTTWLKKHN